MFKRIHKKQLRAQRKRELLERLDQQRIELMIEGMRVERRATSIDRGWQFLVRHKTPLLIASGGFLWQLFRHPRTTLNLSQRALSGYILYRKIRRLN